MEERLRRVMRFWGIKRAPRPRIVKDEKALPVPFLPEGVVALFSPEKKLIIVPRSEESLEAAFTYWLRYVQRGAKMHMHKPVEEMLGHITMRALGLRSPLPEDKRKALELASIRTLDTLTRAYTHIRTVREEIERRNEKEQVSVLKDIEEDLKQTIQDIMVGKSFKFGRVYSNLRHAINVLNKTLPELRMEDLAVKDVSVEEVSDFVDYWSRLIAEDAVEKVKSMPVEERRRFFERAHLEFYKLALEYVRRRSPELAERLERIVTPPKERFREAALQKLRMYKELLGAYARRRVIKA